MLLLLDIYQTLMLVGHNSASMRTDVGKKLFIGVASQQVERAAVQIATMVLSLPLIKRHFRLNLPYLL
jgi:hypothetical protein